MTVIADFDKWVLHESGQRRFITAAARRSDLLGDLDKAIADFDEEAPAPK